MNKKMNIEKHFKLKGGVMDPHDMKAREEFYATLKRDVEYKLGKRHCGIEIECEGITSPFPANTWHPETDHSLKMNGAELVTLPLSGESFDLFFHEYKAFIKKQPELTFTHRCSIHVHVNVRDLKLPQFVALVAAYICLEDLFFNEVEPIRRNNSYCTPTADFGLSVNDLLKRYPYAKENPYKYGALNFGVASSYGTVEFRHLEGTKDINKIVKWVQLCQDFVEYFALCDPEAVFHAIFDLNSVSFYETFIVEIFGYNPWPQLDLQKFMERNVAIAKYMVGDL